MRQHHAGMGDVHFYLGMKQTTPIISRGMNALRLPAFFENLGHSNVILTAASGSFGHKDGPTPGAISCRQGEEAWKAGHYNQPERWRDRVRQDPRTNQVCFLHLPEGCRPDLSGPCRRPVSMPPPRPLSAPAWPLPRWRAVSLKALDQSSRYADLSLDEATLIREVANASKCFVAGACRVADRPRLFL